ncbi:hypothetical protein [Marinomonas mediterranea]|jgi:hypothetical protein|uniref:Uncharacterized protein n=1 Tax=Marinomonas mediterranea (strain ATCC 700492 / JCM 21426 / NBRC 103028 / MMB-1) TaxID=717774 RepID=F2K309_MARM1|nr:hypothetical protein [Marinomonas mediterranea]ADZ92398.1 hypothetical protein Marme_3181 [Marinomonas mediterranea MMB-1]WCN10350.1 hypothetical protein GV055_16200 [Marinomonas mediterranea]WCN14396.1 hypothetical protein GV054_16025 [Marinomonas mediterranea]WCN18448.1 hypothetical protein GV053_16090 [Marinomonas mediterranea MMB-1]
MKTVISQSIKVKLSGYLSLIQGAIFLISILWYVILLMPIGVELRALSVDQLALITEHKGMLQLFYGIAYVLFALLLVGLNIAICKVDNTSIMNNIALIMGSIWSGFLLGCGLLVIASFEYIAMPHSDNSIKLNLLMFVSVIVEAIGGGNELVGGIWVASISISLKKACHIGSSQCLLGLAIGVIGIMTVVPSLGELGALFGIGMIVWFAALGVTQLKSREGAYA